MHTTTTSLDCQAFDGVRGVGFGQAGVPMLLDFYMTREEGARLARREVASPTWGHLPLVITQA